MQVYNHNRGTLSRTATITLPNAPELFKDTIHQAESSRILHSVTVRRRVLPVGVQCATEAETPISPWESQGGQLRKNNMAHLTHKYNCLSRYCGEVACGFELKG